MDQLVATTPFDAEKFKQTTCAQWEAAAEAWDRWGPFIGEWLGNATETMLRMAHIGPGSQVLDVAAGAGEQSIAAGRRLGPTGRVLATDISPKILSYARQAAEAAGLGNIQTLQLDGESLETLEAGSFDAVISRVGLIYFPNQSRALQGFRHCLRPEGRISVVVYSTPEQNAFFSLPVSIIRRRAHLPAPLPTQPGPFSLGRAGVIESVLAKAGFGDIEVETVNSPVRLPSAAECTRFERESFGALHQMLSGLTESERTDTWDEIEEALRQFETSAGFVGPCEMLVASATR